MTSSEDLTSNFRLLHETLTSGFKMVVDAIGETNRRVDGLSLRVDQTNERIDRTNERLDLTIVRLDQTVERLDQTVERLDQTVERLDLTNRRIDMLHEDMNKRFDGVTSYLRSINGSVLDHSERLYRLEQRVKKLEDEQGAA